MIDENLQAELRERFNPDGSVLRKAQLRMLDMLEYIDKICTQNNLVYWLDSGTLLGAARHGGFIPWDDDMDVCMPREDMIKLAEILNTSSNNYILQTPYNDPGFFNTGYVLRDLNSEYISNDPFHQRRKYRGVQIDIFPLEDRQNSFLYRIGNLLHLVLVDNPCHKNTPNWIIRIFDRLLRNAVYPLIRLICKRSPDLYRMDLGCGFRSLRFKKNIYPIKKIEFEGGIFNAPNNIDGYLTDIYKNWRVVPNINNIRTHNVNIRI